MGREFDEESPPHPNDITRSALDGEGIAQEMAKLHGFAASVLRCGWFYGADSAHTRMLAGALAKRQMPIIGQGNAFWHCLHLDDAASGFVAAAEAGRVGPVAPGRQRAGAGRRVADRVGQPAGRPAAASYAGLAGAAAGRQSRRRLLYAIHAHQQRPLPPRLRLDAQVSDLLAKGSTRSWPNCARQERTV